MDLDLILRGIGIGFVVAAPIGPVNLVCIHRTLRHGRLHGFLVGLGAALADALFAVVAAFGFTAISDWLLAHEGWLRLAGGLFLLVLGVRTFRSVPSAPDSAGDDGRRNLLQALAFTFFLTITNPMTILGFAAVFAGAGVATEARDLVSATTLVLGVLSGSALWWLCLATGVGFFHGRVTVTGLRRLNQGSGLVILGFGAVALASFAGVHLPL